MINSSWQLIPGFDPLWQIWDDDIVVYDRFSGSTHLVDVVSAELIHCLASGPLKQHIVIQRLAVSHECDVTEEFAEMVRLRLQGLAQRGVVECLAD